MLGRLSKKRLFCKQNWPIPLVNVQAKEAKKLGVKKCVNNFKVFSDYFVPFARKACKQENMRAKSNSNLGINWYQKKHMKDKFLYFLWILLTVLYHRLVVLTGYIHLVQKFIFPYFYGKWP